MQFTTIFCAFAIASTQASAGIMFIDLKHAPPGNAPFDTPYSTAANGKVIVGTTGIATETSGNEAAVWTPSTGSIGLGILTQSARGVSGDGLVVVGGSGSLLGDMAYRWTEQSGVVGLGYLPGHGKSTAYAASFDGSVIVGESSAIGGGQTQAFRWTQASHMVDIGPGVAYDISDDGSVVVGSNYAGSGFRWTDATGQVIVGPGQATAISSDGSVVVGYGSFDSLGTRGWVWSQSGGLETVGELAGGGGRSEIHAVSGGGDIAVGSSDGPFGEEAIMWDRTHGIRSITGVLRDDFDFHLDGLSLTRAHGISEDGRVIVGFGTNPNTSPSQFAWRLTLPEPSTAFLLLFGCTLVVRR